MPPGNCQQDRVPASPTWRQETLQRPQRKRRPQAPDSSEDLLSATRRCRARYSLTGCGRALQSKLVRALLTLTVWPVPFSGASSSRWRPRWLIAQRIATTAQTQATVQWLLATRLTPSDRRPRRAGRAARGADSCSAKPGPHVLPSLPPDQLQVIVIEETRDQGPTAAPHSGRTPPRHPSGTQTAWTAQLRQL